MFCAHVSWLFFLGLSHFWGFFFGVFFAFCCHNKVVACWPPEGFSGVRLQGLLIIQWARCVCVLVSPWLEKGL